MRVGLEDTPLESPVELPVIPMSFEEYDLMENPYGWKVEYWDGHARLTPRSIGVTTKIQLTPRHFPHNHRIIPVSPDYREQMLAGYLDAFSDSVEFCGCAAETIRNIAIEDLDNYFSGRRGEPLPSSVLALAPDSEEVAGLALLVNHPKKGAFMQLLYVRPAFQGQGIATVMLYSTVTSLLESGVQTLSSSYHICNEQSRQWYHRHGFEDQYDWFYAKLKVSWYRSEIRRRETLGLTEGLADLEQERDRWAALVKELSPEDWDDF